MQRTAVLKQVDKSSIKPGIYLCAPLALDKNLWLVEVFDHDGFACYQLPRGEESEAIRVVSTCGHTFFELPDSIHP